MPTLLHGYRDPARKRGKYQHCQLCGGDGSDWILLNGGPGTFPVRDVVAVMLREPADPYGRAPPPRRLHACHYCRRLNHDLITDTP